MHRRAFVRDVTCSLVVVAPLFATAEALSVRRIGWLVQGQRTPADVVELRNAALGELGWTPGRNLLIEHRYASNKAERLQPLAEELVRLKVELIVTEGTAATQAAKKATTTIPIVMWTAGDPVRVGLVASLARPGGNVTGNSIVGPDLEAKRLSVMRELLPSTQRVGELENSTTPYYRATRETREQAYRSLGMQPIFVEVGDASELAEAIAAVFRQHAQALHVPRDDLFFENAEGLMRSASKYALPAIVDEDALLDAGGLLLYTFSEAEVRRRGAAFIDKILRGAKPADLPVEQPTRFILKINLKAAKALGVTIPQSLLLRADAIIQ
jgi:ABC-type uncharacterized transport system substrate-binding protein